MAKINDSTSTLKTAIIGIGNILLQDDSIGMEIVRMMKNEYLLDEVKYIEAGIYFDIMLDSLKLFDNIVIITALHLGLYPGNVCIISGTKLIPFRRMQYSLHEKNLWNFIRIAKNRYPEKKIYIVCIEPKNREFGIGLNQELLECIPCVVKAVKNLVQYQI